MKAIETTYAGYLFRSRLEARWAVFFDAVDLQWEYEVEGFEFDDGTRYLPDFLLRDWDLWIEIKPVYPTEKEKEKCCKFANEGGKAIALFYGLPGENKGFVWTWDMTDSSGGSCESSQAEWLQRFDHSLGLMLWDTGFRDDRTFYSDCGMNKPLYALWHPDKDGPYQNLLWNAPAFRRAKQARFEHGANGRPA